MIGCVTPRAAGWSADLVQEIYSSLAKDLQHNSHEATNLALALLYDEKRLDVFSSNCNLRLSDKVLKDKHGHQPQSCNTVEPVRSRVENADEHDTNRKKTKTVVSNKLKKSIATMIYDCKNPDQAYIGSAVQRTLDSGSVILDTDAMNFNENAKKANTLEVNKIGWWGERIWPK